MPREVILIAHTTFNRDAASHAVDWKWEPEDHDTDAAALSEFAGRACYASWGKPNPDTAENTSYLAHIQEVGHWSVMEHGTATFYITGVSRSLTHELIRHRHFSPSQLSQRFVLVKDGEAFVTPPLFEGHLDAGVILMEAWENAMTSYEALLAIAEEALRLNRVTGTAAKKQAREAARAVLPNMTPTAIVLSGNHRAWREMLLNRVQPEADAEIRAMGLQVFNILADLEPALYQDLNVVTVDGVESLEQLS